MSESTVRIQGGVKRRYPLDYSVDGNTALVRINGRITKMDMEDLHLLDGWSLKIVAPCNHVQLQGTVLEKPRRHVILARLIMNAPTGMEVDHISTDTLDNRKANLRICTMLQNRGNRNKQANNSSVYKGVTYNKHRYNKRKKWQAKICSNGVHIHLGRFLTAEEAAAAYNTKAVELFGEFARLNVIERPGETVPAGGVS